MNCLTYDKFFRKATGPDHSPYGYQCRLACGPQAKPDQPVILKEGTTCQSQLINIPTGLGKTAAVVLAWLWNRIHLKCETWPRRLVYCLPMRTLVEQTRDEVHKWLSELAKAFPTNEELQWLAWHSPIILMGGEELDDAKREWDVYPERPAILIGTQDMLLSRALNRGYGMSRYRWPMHFGLLNNDCLWVMDETQLMGAGLSTACQLEAFREAKTSGFGSFGGNGSVTWYVSATSNPEHLRTREWREVKRPEHFESGLTTEEKAATSGPVAERLGATKKIKLEPTQYFGAKDKQPDLTLIETIVRRHRELTQALQNVPAKIPRRSLIICNTVDQAIKVHAAIKSALGEAATENLLLMHSRFRPFERREQARRLTSECLATFSQGQIVVATQVIEAGVDLSSALLWTEIAPLASIVQRLGRLNRSGEFGFNKQAAHDFEPEAVVLGIEAPEIAGNKEEKARKEREADNAYLPYARQKSLDAFTALELLADDASPRHLDIIQSQIQKSIERCPYSLQRHELLDFFDTDANLSLGFTDVSPFVRGLDEDTDLQVLWRENWLQENGEEGTDKPGFSPDYQRDELCPVPISKALEARDVLNHGWHWRGKESGWMSVRDAGLAPGMTILLPLEAGGYDQKVGWTGKKNDKDHPSHYQPQEWPTDEEQLSSFANGWQSIAAHTDSVALELRGLLQRLLVNEETERNALGLAVSWHDIGKSHPGWQQEVVAALKKADISAKEDCQTYAKFQLSDSPQVRNTDGSTKFTGKQLYAVLKKIARYFRPGVAHEVASALAFRQAEQKRLGLVRDTNLASLLAEYVIMSHHGRVRKVLRDEIPKFPTDEKDTDTVRGVSEDDPLPAVTIEGQSLGCESLSTECRKMGREVRKDGTLGHESYTRGVLRLLEHYGPFRLAFFETLLRAADIRASIKAKQTP